MSSAFGVDHGDEVSKIGRNKMISDPKKNRAIRAGLPKPGSKFGTLKALPKRVGEAQVSINDVGRGTSRGVTAIGELAAKKPGLTGAAILGGGGYAAYRGLQRKDLPKRKNYK